MNKYLKRLEQYARIIYMHWLKEEVRMKPPRKYDISPAVSGSY